jgi:hypothetical protein
MIPFLHPGGQMSFSRKAFVIWLALMIPAVLALTIAGLICDICYRTDLAPFYRALPGHQ